MSNEAWLLLPLLALGLDALLGDPRGWPHPVRLLGLALNRLEFWIRARVERIGEKCGNAQSAVITDAKVKRLRQAGVATVVLIAGGSGLVVYLFSIAPGIGWLCALYFAYAGLAARGLIHEVNQAQQILRLEGVEAGRVAVSGLVSRDVSTASEDDLYRALAETLSENLNDAVIAPFFWLCLAGPWGLWVYKAVSTMDSMWGYKTERWRDLGWAAARLDDILAWVPARLTAFILRFTMFKVGESAWSGWTVVAGQARKMSSPNAGWPMTVAAWLHGRAMGGPTLYRGEVTNKPHLGPENAIAWDNASLEGLLRHVSLASWLGCFIIWLALILINQLVR
jgi:adenosylcobinamide-phosphate synthase